MEPKVDRLESMSSLLTAVETGSLSAASRRLGMPLATVSRIGGIDIATPLHPQTLPATGYAEETLSSPSGYPRHLPMATKLGCKNPK